MQASDGRIVSIALDIVSKETARKVKTTLAQLKVSSIDESKELQLLAACEEGMFEARFSPSKLKKAKTRNDLSPEDWEKITLFLFRTDVLTERYAPAGFENIALTGRLLSSEEYDIETGELMGEELSESPPGFEISVRTNENLPVEYGSLQLLHVDTEELSYTERERMNLLTWISQMSSQVDSLQTMMWQKNHRVEELEVIKELKDKTIEEMESDYKVILRDIEERFYQVLETKKRKIAELESGRTEQFDAINDTYKQRQKSNLKILNLEDIIVGDADKHYGERKRKREVKARPSRLKKASATAIRNPDDLTTNKKTRSPVELGNNNLHVKDSQILTEENNSDADKYDYQPRYSGDVKIERSSSTDIRDSPPASNSECTDYSEPDEAEKSHVSSAQHTPSLAASPSVSVEDDENETEYSD